MKKKQIDGEEDSFFPPNMFIRYIGEECEEFTRNACYKVYVDYGNHRWFGINNDKNEGMECPAEWFEMVDVGEMLYTGLECDDGTFQVTDGFVVGERYPVYGFKRGKYQCGNGMECYFVECEPTVFVPARPVDIRPFRHPDEALRDVRRAMEFGESRSMENRLLPECEYISQSTGLEYHDAKTIIEHVRDTAEEQLEQNFFMEFVFATVTGTQEGNRFGVGERCMPVFTQEGLQAVVFVTHTDKWISGVYVLKERYEFEIDAPDREE